MARFQRHNTRPLSRGPRRQFDWIGGVNALSHASPDLAANTSVIISSFDTRTAGQTPGAPFTLMRVRGLLSIRSDQVIVQENPVGAFGIRIVSGEAFDAGVGSIPTPWSESADDRWLYHTYWQSFFMENATTSDYQQDFFNHIVDGKAMRKVVLGDVIVNVMENASDVACNFFYNARIGVKLH